MNRTLYHGDNLDFLRGINSETIHLIATDPPFNKNRDFHATPDSLAAGARFKDRWRWDEDVHEEWTDSIIDDYPAVWEVITAARAAYGDDMGAFLCWLGVRLMEMRRVLRQDGSIYLHMDQTAHAYVKCMMDAIFGAKNFRNAIIWRRQNSNNSVTKKFGTITDTILFYAKSAKVTWNQQYRPRSAAEMKEYRRDEQGRLYKAQDLTAPGHNPKRMFMWRGTTPSRNWGHSLQKLEQLWREGRILLGKNGMPRQRGLIQYLHELPPGGKLQNLWDDVPRVGNTAKERTGFPTQKPLALYERIIRASSNEGDWVLDPFCGCATTPIAAERLKRKWVGMDIWDGARKQVFDRLERDTVLRYGEQGHVTLPQVHIETAPPVRTDDSEEAVKPLELKSARYSEPWHRVTHRGMTNVLAAAQASSGGVICAGCGRVLEREFMQLDHITPKSGRGENHILNRILLCGPCNRRKGDSLTMPGLLKENRKKTVGWMRDESLAKLAQEAARERAEWLRDNFASAECQALIAGRRSLV
ncbi:MAG: DNA methyltransferase [Chloroflexi bacterium]|nr:DNA methyltransferase [Chloroflexota bacterium]